MHVWLYTHMHTRTYTRIHIYTHICINTHIYICVFIHMYVRIHIIYMWSGCGCKSVVCGLITANLGFVGLQARKYYIQPTWEAYSSFLCQETPYLIYISNSSSLCQEAPYLIYIYLILPPFARRHHIFYIYIYIYCLVYALEEVKWVSI